MKTRNRTTKSGKGKGRPAVRTKAIRRRPDHHGPAWTMSAARANFRQMLAAAQKTPQRIAHRNTVVAIVTAA